MSGFLEKNVISENDILDVVDSIDSKRVRAQVYIDNPDGTRTDITNPEHRSTWRYPEIQPVFFPSLTESIRQWANELSPEPVEVLQFDCLLYEAGDRFRPHTDGSGSLENSGGRMYTTVTMLNKSDDLEGGELLIYEEGPDSAYTSYNLEIGETVMFPSMKWHEATEVITGSRLVLVIWLGKKGYPGR